MVSLYFKYTAFALGVACLAQSPCVASVLFDQKVIDDEFFNQCDLLVDQCKSGSCPDRDEAVNFLAKYAVDSYNVDRSDQSYSSKANKASSALISILAQTDSYYSLVNFVESSLKSSDCRLRSLACDAAWHFIQNNRTFPMAELFNIAEKAFFSSDENVQYYHLYEQKMMNVGEEILYRFAYYSVPVTEKILEIVRKGFAQTSNEKIFQQSLDLYLDLFESNDITPEEQDLVFVKKALMSQDIDTIATAIFILSEMVDRSFAIDDAVEAARLFVHTTDTDILYALKSLIVSLVKQNVFFDEALELASRLISTKTEDRFKALDIYCALVGKKQAITEACAALNLCLAEEDGYRGGAFECLQLLHELVLAGYAEDIAIDWLESRSFFSATNRKTYSRITLCINLVNRGLYVEKAATLAARFYCDENCYSNADVLCLYQALVRQGCALDEARKAAHNSLKSNQQDERFAAFDLLSALESRENS